jgi:hypothetical protein
MDAIMKIVKIFIQICSIFLLIHHSLASEGFYTVQTGTYTPASLGYAKRHFDKLSRTLEENDRHYLRIEQGERYIIVRIGKFEGFEEASKLLEKVKTLAPDAFVLKC